MSDGLNMSRRIRRTPYTDRVEACGVRGFSVVNHMLLPKAFQPSIEEDYWHLKTHVQLWDVSCQRQVSIKGKDAAALVQWMTPRNLTKAKIGQCLYIPIIDENAGMINDPVLLKLADDHFWLSIADSDVLLWAKGLAVGAGLTVEIHEPDVSPLAIQGPKAENLMVDLFGDHVRDIGFFKFDWIEFEGTKQLIARSGYSRQGGFEIYLEGGHLGTKLWDIIWQGGQKYQLSAGCPNLIERIEGGLFSYGNEFTRDNNPLECGLEKLCDLEGNFDYIGKAALQKLFNEGVKRQIRGVVFDGGKAPVCGKPWPVMVGTRQVGQITSGVWSPRLEQNVGLSLIDKGYWEIGTKVMVKRHDGFDCAGQIKALPFE